MRIYSSFIKNGLVLTLSTIALKIISIFFSIFLSNNISSNDIGYWSIIMSVFSFLVTISISGINISSTILTSREYVQGNTGNIARIMSFCMKYCMFFSFVAIFILVFFKDFILDIICKSNIDIHFLYILAISIPLCSISSCINGYFMALQKIKNIIIAQFIELTLQVTITIIFYKLNCFRNTYNVCVTLTTSILVSDFVSFLYLFKSYYSDYMILKDGFKTQHNYKIDVINISLPVAITSYIKSGLSALKASIIPISFMEYGFSHNEALSSYGLISGTVITLLLFPFTFIQSYTNLLVPKISSYDIYSKKNIVKKIIKKSILLTFIFSVFICVIFILFANKIDSILYKTLDVGYYIKILSPIIIYIYIDNVIDSILKSINAQIFVVLINILDLVLTILMIKLFIPTYGINSYITILYTSEIFNVALSSYVLHKKLF